MARVEVEATVELTPELLARAFVDMTCKEQAEFFHVVADKARAWGNSEQWQWTSVGRSMSVPAGEVVRCIAAASPRK